MSYLSHRNNAGAVLVVVKQYFDDQILTAQKARKMYQDGAAERTGIQRDSYLAYADVQATRETFLRETHAALIDKLRLL
jgi:hypothetical protein